MSDIAFLLPPTDWARLSLLYSHLLVCVLALGLVASADWRVVRGRWTMAGLQRTARATTLALVALWITGLALVYRDTGFDPGVLATEPKLLLKLLTVAVLSLNGVVLHHVSFPLLARGGRPTLGHSVVLAVTGAMSTSHWLLAAFVGVARPLARWPLETLLGGYAVFVAATIGTALLATGLLRHRLHDGAKQREARAVAGSREPGRALALRAAVFLSTERSVPSSSRSPSRSPAETGS